MTMNLNQAQNPRQRRGVRWQRCRGLTASATPLSRAAGRSNAQSAFNSGVVGAEGLRLAPLPPHSTTLSRLVMMLMFWFMSSVLGMAQQTSIPSKWPGKPYDMVVGYQFANPWGIGGLLPEKGTIELDDLRWLQARSAKLEKPQIDFLLTHTFSSENKSAPAACYVPHHVFVFYSKDQAVAAIEVCLECSFVYCWPDTDISKTWNIPQLRHLCALLKLGTKAPEKSDDIIKNYLADAVRKARFDKRCPPDPFAAPAPAPSKAEK